MPGLLPPVIATLLADTKEYSAKMDEAGAKMEAFGAKADTTGARLGNFANKASTAIIGLGVGVAAVGVDLAIKFQTALDQVQNTTNATAATIDKIAKSATNLSNVTVNSATDIVGAYQAVEAAGYGWAKAQDTVTAAAKLAQITQQNVVTTTQSLIAAQELGITKGFSAAKTADLFTIALKGNEAGLAGVVALLQGKVGAAFAQYHQSASEAVSIANVLSQAHYSNTRALAALVGKIGEFQTEMIKTTVTNGKVSSSTSSWVSALLSAGLSVDKTKQAFTGPDGLVNGLKYLQSVSHGSLSTLNKDLIAVFGTSGSAAASLLINQLGQITKTTQEASKASAGGLNTAFNISQSNVDNQLKELKNQAENILRGIGLFLLPGVTDLAHWSEDAIKYFEAHPLIKKIASDSAIGLFGAAVAFKIAKGITSAVSGIKSLFGSTAISLNTTATQENTDALLGRAGVGGGGVVAGGGLGTFGKSVLVFAAGVAAFEGTTQFLRTKEGKKVGNYIIDNNFLGIGTLSNTIADLTGVRVRPSTTLTGSADEKYLKSIGEWGNYQKLQLAELQNNYAEVQKLTTAIQKRENRGKVTINVGYAKGLSR